MSTRLAVLLSGTGRSLQNLLDRHEAGTFAPEVVLVIASRPDAYGLERAKAAGIATLVLRRKAYDADEAYASAVFNACREAKADLVVLAGFLVLLRPIPDDFRGRVLNIHPALLPSHGGKGYYGDRVHAAVLAAGDAETGCTVHLVDGEYDHGERVLQRRVPVLPGDDVHTLAKRVFDAECEALPEAILERASRFERPDPDDYATCSRTKATLWIHDVEPTVVTQLLGIPPDQTQQQRPASRPGATVGRAAAKPHGWCLSSEHRVASVDVRKHIGWVLDRLEGRQPALEELRRQGARTSVSCYWLSATGHGGPWITPELSLRLGALGLDCWFDVYFHGAFRDRPLFDRVDAALADGLTHSAAEDVDGFAMDLEHALSDCAAIGSFSLRPRTAASVGTLEVDAKLAPDVDSLQSLARALRAMWSTVGYRAFASDSIEHHRDATVLRFASASPPNLFVTGRVVVSGPPHADLAARCEAHFGPLTDRPR